MKISTFCVTKKNVLHIKFILHNRIEKTNAFLDSSRANLGQKIIPEIFLFINNCDFLIFVIYFSAFFVY